MTRKLKAKRSGERVATALEGSDQRRSDLVVIVADTDMEQAFKALLARPASLGIAPIQFKVERYSGRDSGCRVSGVTFVRMYQKSFKHALLCFDWEGCGAEQPDAPALEEALDRQFQESGWGDCARALVIDPELEAWVWTSSPILDSVTGWKSEFPPLRDWISGEGFSILPGGKPVRPKEALLSVLRHTKTPMSPHLFRSLAEKVSLKTCSDRAFQRLVETLRSWFPETTPAR